MTTKKSHARYGVSVLQDQDVSRPGSQFGVTKIHVHEFGQRRGILVIRGGSPLPSVTVRRPTGVWTRDREFASGRERVYHMQ